MLGHLGRQIRQGRRGAMVTLSLTRLLFAAAVPIRLRRNPEVLCSDLPWGNMPIDDLHSPRPTSEESSSQAVSWPDAIPIRILDCERFEAAAPSMHAIRKAGSRDAKFIAASGDAFHICTRHSELACALPLLRRIV